MNSEKSMNSVKRIKWLSKYLIQFRLWTTRDLFKFGLLDIQLGIGKKTGAAP